MSIGIPRKPEDIRHASIENSGAKPAPRDPAKIRWASGKPTETGNSFADREQLRAEEESQIILPG